MTESPWLTAFLEVLPSGTVGVLIGIWISHRRESAQARAQQRRWYAEYFLGRKMDALNNLFVALSDCYFTMNHYGNCHPSTFHEYKAEVQSAEDAYRRASVLASVYLNDEANQTMSGARGAFRQASMAIYLHLPDGECRAIKASEASEVRNVDFKRLSEAYEDAFHCLKEVLNPKILKRVEEEK